jgi:hypothetical protein
MKNSSGVVEGLNLGWDERIIVPLYGSKVNDPSMSLTGSDGPSVTILTGSEGPEVTTLTGVEGPSVTTRIGVDGPSVTNLTGLDIIVISSFP